jgi:hypothetical protein
MKANCFYTHGLLSSGTCPWCDCPIVEGQPRPDIPPRESAVRRWNVPAMLKALDSEDKEARQWVSSHLLGHYGPKPAEGLPVLRKAIHDREETVRSLAISALRSHGGELTSEEAEQFEHEVERYPEDSALRILLLGYYFLPATMFPAARSARHRHVLWVIEHAPEMAIIGGAEVYLDLTSDGDVYNQARVQPTSPSSQTQHASFGSTTASLARCYSKRPSQSNRKIPNGPKS